MDGPGRFRCPSEAPSRHARLPTSRSLLSRKCSEQLNTRGEERLSQGLGVELQHPALLWREPGGPPCRPLRLRRLRPKQLPEGPPGACGTHVGGGAGKARRSTSTTDPGLEGQGGGRTSAPGVCLQTRWPPPGTQSSCKRQAQGPVAIWGTNSEKMLEGNPSKHWEGPRVPGWRQGGCTSQNSLECVPFRGHVCRRSPVDGDGGPGGLGTPAQQALP